MKKLLVVIIALGLVGCKSLDYVRSTSPVIQGATSKSVEAFSTCVLSKWSGSGGHVTSLPINDGISLQIPQPMGGYDLVLDISKDVSGSKYVLYERISALTSSSYGEAVKQCQ